MLTLLTQEDAEELQKLRYDLETSEAEKRRMANIADQQDTVIKQMQDQVFHLEHCKFVADVQAKTIEQQDRNIKELIEENKLLNAQVTMDAETIRALHTQLNEAVLERDRLATRVGKAIQRRGEAEGEVKMLLEHASELRDSNVRLAARIATMEEQIRSYEDEDYADFFTRVSRRDIAKGSLMPSEAQMLMVRRQGTPPDDERLADLVAKDVAISAELLQRLLPGPPPVSVSQALQQRLQVLPSPQGHGAGGGGMLQLSPEQIRLLGASIAASGSPNAKKFSSKGFELQFGISPQRSSGPRKGISPDAAEARTSKEVHDLVQRTTDLPPPKSHQASPIANSKSAFSTVKQQLQQSPSELEGGEAPAAVSSSSSIHVNHSLVPNPAAGGVDVGGIVKASSSPKSSSLPQPPRQPPIAASATAMALAQTDRAFADAREELQLRVTKGDGGHGSGSGVVGGERKIHDSGSTGLPRGTTRPAASVPAVPEVASGSGVFDGGERIEPDGHQPSKSGAIGGAGGMQSDPAARVSEPQRVVDPMKKATTNASSSSTANSSSGATPAPIHRHRHLVSLPVRDALSGSIVAEETGEMQGGEADADDTVLGRTAGTLSPSQGYGVDSDSDTEIDSPSRTMDRNSLLKERLEVQRANARQGQGQQGPSITSSPTSFSAQGPSFRTVRQQLQQHTSSNGTTTSSQQILPSLQQSGGASRVLAGSGGAVGWDEVAPSTHYPPHGKGGTSILKSSASLGGVAPASPPQKAQKPSAAAVGGRKVLAPLATTATPLLPVHDRPSTCPLIIEAIYGERVGGEGSAGAGEKMYLVKYVSVESEQWTSASNVDPSCDALRNWLRSKAKGRVKQQGSHQGVPS